VRIWAWLALAVLAGCGPNLSALRHRVTTDHYCSLAEVVSVDETGAWVKACGWNRRYERGPSGTWVEDASQAFAMGAEPPASHYAAGSAGGGYSGGGGGGSVHVHGYTRRDGTYVRGHTRRSPRRH
jgi:hypothetical protein